MAEQPKTLNQRLDDLFEPYARSDRPGFVIGVAHQEKVVYRKGFGLASIEHSVANTPATRMRIGSTSKHFTSLAAFLLAAEGMLDIDAGIRTYLPDLPPLQGDPSLRQIMSHTGGYRCPLDISFISDGLAIKPAGETLASALRQTDVNFNPGDKMIYNNGGYHMLSLIIENVSGMPFERFLEEQIFEPLGMKDTRSVPSDFEIHPRMATMHLPSPDGSWRRGIFPTEEVRGEGAMISTVDDMLVWLAHLRGEKQVGNQSSWDQITTSTRLNDGVEIEYCLGLLKGTYRGIEVLHHGGGVIGGACQMITAPDHALDVIIITNGVMASPMDLASQVIDAVLGDEVLSKPAEKPETGKYENLIGRYQAQKSGFIYDIADMGGMIGFGVLANPPIPLTKVDNHLELLFSSGGMGPYRIKLPSSKAEKPVEQLELYDCGETEVLHRLTVEPPRASNVSNDLIGSYFCADINAPGDIIFDKGELVLVIHGHFGGNRLTLEPVTADVLTFLFHISLQPVKGTFHIERKDDMVTGFRLNTPRTRHLRFERQAQVL